jgi:hypothetical protein
MLYSIFRIDDIGTRRNSYVALSAVIFVVPLSTFLFLLWSPYPSVLEKRRTEWAKRSPCKLDVLFQAAVKSVN